MKEMYEYLIIYIGAFGLSMVVARLMIGLGPRLGLMDEPSERRIHAVPVPRAGGVGIWLVFLLICGLASIAGMVPVSLNGGPFLAFLVSSGVLMGVGFIDDRWGTTPLVKLTGQIVAALLFWMLSGDNKGNLAGYPIPVWVDCVVWVLWIVLLVNAYNLIDGLDGLCGGLAWISLAGTLVAAASLGISGSSIGLVVIMMAAVMGFLIYNRSPARLFLGDAGSMLLGLFIATVATELVGRRTVGAVVLLPIAVAGVPLFDVLLAVWRRLIKKVLQKVRGEKGGGLFDADREHLHHRLLARGWSQRKVAEVLQACAAAVMLICFLPLIMGTQGWALMIPLFFLLGVFLLRHIASVELIQSGNAIQLALKKPGADKRRRVVYMVVDVALILTAWLGEYLIEKKTLALEEDPFLLSYVLAQVVGSIAALHFVGVYRTVWRRALILEMGVVFWGLVTVAVLLGVMTSLSFDLLSVWVLIKVAVGGAFLSAIAVLIPRAISPLIVQMALGVCRKGREEKGKRILVYGAGDLGTLYLDFLATRVRASDFAELVGFIDDDDWARGRTLRGFRILGKGEDVGRIILDRRIDEVVVAIDELPAGFMDQLRKSLQGTETELMRWSCGLDKVERPSQETPWAEIEEGVVSTPKESFSQRGAAPGTSATDTCGN